MIRRTLAACIAALSLCSSCAQPIETSGRTEAIAGGTRETGQPAVVLIYDRSVGAMCTGTIIAPRVVLTAKHCVQNPGATGPSSPRSFVVGVGSSIQMLSESLSVDAVVTTEGVWTDGGVTGLDGALVGQDVAVLTLRAPTDITPMPIRRDKPEDIVGTEVRLTGFGETPSGGSGVKYTTTTTLNRIRGNLLQIGPSICRGDSGGPMVTGAGEVIGVASFGTGSCGSGQNSFNALFEYVDMIDAAIVASGACAPTGDEICDGIDNDCNDLVDEVCSAVGEPCEYDDECETQLCADTVAGHICTAACDPSQKTLECGAGFYCDGSTGCAGLCVPGTRGALAIGEPCTVSTDCASLLCVGYSDGTSRCSDPCRGDTGMCLAGEVCSAGASDCGACMGASSSASAPRNLGEPCDAGEQCASGQCIDSDGSTYCSRSCERDDECGTLFHCGANVCVRGRREGNGGSCSSNDDCTDDTVCATQNGRSWCASLCATEEDCPDDFECASAEGGTLCAPERALLGESCDSNDACVSGRCESETCVRECATDSPCPMGFECARRDDGSAFCERPGSSDGGGCNVSYSKPTTATPWLVLLGLFFAAFAIRARRRRAAVAAAAIAAMISGCSETHESGDGKIFFTPREDSGMPDDDTDGGVVDPEEDAETPVEVAPGSLGTACESDGDCTTGGCYTDLPGGYCTMNCTTDADCGETGACLITSQEGGICTALCDSTSDTRTCRAGYGCGTSLDLPADVCLPGCSDDSDCAVGKCDPTGGSYGSGRCYDESAEVGDACDDDSACGPGATCNTEGDWGWPSGACTVYGCTSNSDCGEDGACVAGQFGGQCVKGCGEDADCREGYACLDGACAAHCADDSQCSDGRVCHVGRGLCDAPFTPDDLGAACGDGSTCAGGVCLDERFNGFPNTACAYAGCDIGTSGSCPGDGVCVESSDGSGLCIDGCATSEDCRDAYTCRPSDYDVEGSPTICMPGCTADTDCTSGRTICNEGTGRCTREFNPDELGIECTGGFRECRGGRCMREDLDGWPGGMCVFAGCRLSGEGGSEACPEGSLCADDGAGDPAIGYCLPACTIGGDDCRDGYGCTAVPGFEHGVCKPD